MSTLRPGQHTAAAAKLRKLMAIAESKSVAVKELPAPKLKTDFTATPAGTPNREGAGEDAVARYNGANPDGYGGGVGPRIGVTYNNTL